MKAKRVGRVVMGALMALGVATAAVAPGWAQQTAPPPDPWPLPTIAEDAPARTALATVGSVVGSFFYIPFKVLGICPGMALAAGVHYAATLGKDTPVDQYLVRAGCTGTYFITPGMVRGQEEFQGAGAR